MAGEHLYIGLLGPFEVRVDGVLAGPGGDRRRGLLALLALEANSVVPIDSLIDRIWGDSPPSSAVNVVQTYVSTWRKALGHRANGDSPLITLGSGYRLELGTEECDRLMFRSAAAAGRRAEAEGRFPESAAEHRAALDLWRGPPLVDLTREPFHPRVAADLEADRIVAEESWARASLRAGGDPTEVAAVLTAARRRDPLRESLTELQLWALTAAGRQADAIDAFTETRRLLVTELGADPGPSLAAMYERVLRADPTLQIRPRDIEVKASSTHAATSGRTFPTSRADRFFGRAVELDRIEELLTTRRLVTLTGPGGSGKTRLATEMLVRRGAADAPAWFVELAPLRDVDLVGPTIAASVDVQIAAGTDPLEALVAHLSTTEGLVVLDNVEHLSGVHEVVATLLRGSNRLRLLVTSREPLRIEGEQQVVVPLLPVPEMGVDVEAKALMEVDSVRLLVDRARANDPTFAVDERNAGTIAEIVRRLDGLPLALEIVAPWLRVLSPADLAQRLAEAPLDVPGRRADAPDRHRTLRDTIQWSFDLMQPRQRELLMRLTVFAGSFSTDAVDAACSAAADSPGAGIESLFDLVDRNLVRVVEAVGDQTRFRMLETVREFARERLDAELTRTARDEVRARHALWYSRWAAKLAGHSEGPEAPKWLALAVAEADNLRAAIGWYQEVGDPVSLLQLVVDSMTLWFEAGHEQEGIERLDAALDAAGPDAPARAIGLTYWAWLRAAVDRTEAADAATEALSVARQKSDPLVEAFALQTLGGTLSDAKAAEAASREVFDAADRSKGRAVRYGPTAPDAVRCGASHNLCELWQYRSAVKALAFQQDALRLAELEGDRRITAVNAARLAVVMLSVGEVGAAAAVLQRSRELVSTQVTARWEDIVTFAEGQLAMHESRFADAEATFTRLVGSASAGARTLHAVLGAAALADLYIDQSRLDDAAAVLERGLARALSAEPSQTARLLVRRARLSRLLGDDDAAQHDLDVVESTLTDDSLPPERIIWLLESEELAELDRSIASTGIVPPPWEERRRSSTT